MTIRYSEMTKRRKGIITTNATKFKDENGNIYDKNEIINKGDYSKHNIYSR